MKVPQRNLINTSVTSNIAVLLICLTSFSGLASAQVRIFAEDSAEAAKEASFMKPDEPILWSGNPSCKALNDSGNPAFEHIQTDRELKLDFTPPTTTTTYPFTAKPAPNERILIGPPDPANSVTTRRIGNSLNWTSTKGIAAVIVKGGPKANVYVYPTPSFGDTGLRTPNNGGYGISHVSFCYYTPGIVKIIKEVQAFGGGTASTAPFPFTATGLSSGSFSLVDNNAQPADRFIDSGVYTFDGSDAITVTESLVPHWTLADIICTETADGDGQLPNIENTTIDFANRKAIIRVEEGETVQCIFKNLQLVPTAANASVEGRVFMEGGRGISRARITVINMNTSEVRTALTNSFGHFKIDELPVGFFYTVSVDHKRYKFENGTVSFTLDDDLTGLDFVGSF